MSDRNENHCGPTVGETTSIPPVGKHPEWCEGYVCEVRPLYIHGDRSVAYAGNHVGGASILSVQGQRIEVARTAFHDTDDEISETRTRVRVIDTAFIGEHADAYLNREQLKELAQMLESEAELLGICQAFEMGYRARALAEQASVDDDEMPSPRPRHLRPVGGSGEDRCP
jgi:hypothetical protein